MEYISLLWNKSFDRDGCEGCEIGQSYSKDDETS